MKLRWIWFTLGSYNFIVEHSFDLGKTFTQRGSLTIHSLRFAALKILSFCRIIQYFSIFFRSNTAVYEPTVSLTDFEKNFKALCEVTQYFLIYNKMLFEIELPIFIFRRKTCIVYVWKVLLPVLFTELFCQHVVLLSPSFMTFLRCTWSVFKITLYALFTILPYFRIGGVLLYPSL